MKILNEIARGGFGRVERIQLKDGGIFARKVFDPSPMIPPEVDREKLLKRFRREVLIQSKLSKDNGNYFIPILKYDLEASEPWFLMPLAEKNLWTDIQLARRNGIVLDEPLADILNSLEVLHNLGFVHRDLKPQNVLYHEGKWKLSDFGLITPSSDNTTTLTSTNSSWGSHLYCAPEQVIDFKNATPLSDIYSFGCILHDIYGTTQRVPYNKHFSLGPIGTIIEKCTEVSSKRRFKNIAGLRGALLAILANPTSMSIHATTEDWIKALEELNEWNDQKVSDFARYIFNLDEDYDRFAIFTEIDEERISILYKKSEESALNIFMKYCEWAQGSFEFSYCDVIIKRLEYIFELGDMSCKAIAAISAAELGSYHNRWYVMGRVIAMCSKRIDEKLADRIAIEIIAEEKQREFRRCAEQLNYDIDVYHPSIVKVLES